MANIGCNANRRTIAHPVYGRILLRGTNGRGAGVAAGASSVALAAHTQFTHDERKRVEGAYFVHKQRKTEREEERERERERTLLANNKEEEKDVLCARQLTFSHFPLAAGHVAREREKGKREKRREVEPAMRRGS